MGTDIIEFIFQKYKPRDKRETYVRAVCNIIPAQNKTHCKRKYYRLSRRSQDTNMRPDHHETPCKQRHIRRQIEVHVHGHERFYLNNKMDRAEYHDTDSDYTTGIYEQI